MSRWWLSTTRMTVLVECDEQDIITATPPIVRKFIGQPIDNLIAWMKKQPGLRYMRLK